MRPSTGESVLCNISPTDNGAEDLSPVVMLSPEYEKLGPTPPTSGGVYESLPEEGYEQVYWYYRRWNEHGVKIYVYINWTRWLTANISE